jgi:hypothetical protein
MLRFAIIAVALAGLLATTHPTLAEPLAAASSDQAQAQAAPVVAVQPAPLARGWSPSADAAAPVGFGWG